MATTPITMPGWEPTTLHRDFQGREPQSWEESLAFYKHAQATRPFTDEAYAKPRRVTHAEISRKQVEYNPITQTWRDESRERAARERDKEETLRAQNQAMDRQLANQRSTHDVLNHQRRRHGLPDPQQELGLTFPVKKREQRLAHPLDSMVPYNIISGLSVEEHHWTPPDQRPQVPPPREDTKLRSVTQQPRDYNVLSNQYKREHEERTAAEAERARRVAAERYWATHDYNVLTTQFYDPRKEEHYRKIEGAAKVRRRRRGGARARARRRAADRARTRRSASLRALIRQAEQPNKAFNKLPPSYQSAEGHVYSITNFSVQNPALYSKFAEREQQTIEHKARKWVREAEIVEKEESRAETEMTRTSQRTSHRRYEVHARAPRASRAASARLGRRLTRRLTRRSARRAPPRPQESTLHGYDIITNKGYHDKDPAPLPPPRTQPKPSEWESLTHSSNTFWGSRAALARSMPRPASEGARSGAGSAPGQGAAADPAAASDTRSVPPLDLAKATSSPAKPALEMTAGSSVRGAVRTGGFAR